MQKGKAPWHALPVKDAYFYPLHRDYRRILSAPA